MLRRVTFGDEARVKLKKGVDLIANAIKVTLGPKGRNVIYGFRYGYPIITKDGVTVARQVECKDETEQLGLALIRQAAQKTADDAGDGTTTAAVLAQAIYTEGLKALGTGANPILIQREIDVYVKEAIEYIKGYVQTEVSPEQLLRVAIISANNDPAIGKLVCDAIEKAGKDGVITIEDNYQDSEDYIHTIEGMQFNEGFLSHYFITDPERAVAEYKNPYILIADYEINHPSYIANILEMAIGREKRPLVIISSNMVGQGIASLVASKMQNGVPILCCKAPYFGDNRLEQLTDLAILTGGKVFCPGSGLKLEEAQLSDLGQCDNIVATKHHTTFSGGKGDKVMIDARIKLIQETIDKCQSDHEKEKLSERLAKLTSGVAVIKVGAPTEVKLKEKKMRIEDALCATKAAMEEGIIAGGGIALLRASQFISTLSTDFSPEMIIAKKIMEAALKEPFKQIAYNAGVDLNEIISSLIIHDKFDSSPLSFNYGYDFLTNKEGDLLLNLGVIDPFKVVRLSLENAVSVAGMLLTTEVIINDEEKEEITRTPRPISE